MKITIIKKGFTLIELLVVITIIGILATGGITVFTAQIQKARDSLRVTSITELEGIAEQVYQGTSEYPGTDTFIADISPYLKKIPLDPKHGQPCTNNGAGDVACGYAYLVATDNNGIKHGSYEFSTAFEYKGALANKAANIVDGGDDPLRKENFGSINNINTTIGAGAITTPTQRGACDITGGIGKFDTKITIAGSGSCL